MSTPDWIVLVFTLAFIVIYGTWKTKGSKNIEGYMLADREMKWGTICLSIMATQASAITFLSTPGQAFEDGMRFIQFYLGLPIAMVIISVTIVPIYSKLNVYTAYEYLETRFDLKTRGLAAILFLIQRGLSTGITIYAPAIVLSTILGWNLTITNIVIGGLVIIYTVSGGTKAVSVTQEIQMLVILTGMVLAGVMVVKSLPETVSFTNAVNLAGNMGKMNIIDFSFNWNERYNFWSGLIGGFFLALSYFGTDQSQVARYLQGKSINESRTGLLLNGMLKIPMQFFILLLGVLLFVFYQYNPQPLFFNQVAIEKVKASSQQHAYEQLVLKNKEIGNKKMVYIDHLNNAIKNSDEKRININKAQLQKLGENQKQVKGEFKKLLSIVDPLSDTKDTDFIFINFILNNLPKGLIGLLLAVIFSAAMSSTASGLNSLGTTTCIDVYKRMLAKNKSPEHYLKSSKWFTILWGVMAIFFAIMASMLDNLIQAVNILGSLFYGTILGIFLTAFYFKKTGSNAVFFAAILAEISVITCYIATDIGFLWYNVIGCLLVITIAYVLQKIFDVYKILPFPTPDK